MASPCEVLVDGGTPREATRLVELAAREALRIERAFSRYRDDNVVHRINTSAGRPVDVDEETARLLDFAERCHALSGGRFDITSGVLRRAWTFDGSSRVPTAAEIEPLLAHVGWQRVEWRRPRLVLPAGMQIDFGGIGKEYAVDRVVALLGERTECPLLVNFGGDLHASAPPESAAAWRVGIEAAYAGGVARAVDGSPVENVPEGRYGEPIDADADTDAGAGAGAGREDHDEDGRPLTPGRAATTLELRRGAMATSGDARRYLLHRGVRYGHVLDPRTGWPVPDAPRSVTVAAASCTQAGLLATLALLHGAGAEALLEEEGVPYWCQRD